MRLLTLAFLTGCTLANVACSVDTVGSDEVKAETIHQDYSLRYDEATDSTQFSAQFRVGGWSGTTVDLRQPATIVANGKSLSKETFLGTRYSGGQRGFVSQVNFEYTDADGKHISNTIRIDPLRLVKADQMVSVRRPYEIELLAVNPVSEESISVGLRQSSPRPDGTEDHLYARGVYDVARGKAIFSTAELNKLNDGPATLVISRSKSTRLQQSTKEGGTIAAFFDLRPVSVTIVDKGPASVQQTLTMR